MRRRIGVVAAALDVTHPTVSDAVAVLRRKSLIERDAATRKPGFRSCPRLKVLG